MSPHNIALKIAYDGTNLNGWQKSDAGPSVESELELILKKVLQQEISLQAASRTDAGVHANCQVVNFLTEKNISPGLLQKSLNALLPSSIRVLAIKKQPVSFHPTLDVIEKEYRYYICNSKIESPINRNFAWHCPYKLDLKYMNLACQKLTGTHDFKALCNSHKDPQPKSTIRTINEIKIIKLPDNQLRIDVLGKNFLFRMVRNIVGLLIYVGRQKILATELEQILISKDRTKAGITAPAHGLFLHRVSYEDANEFSSCDQLLV